MGISVERFYDLEILYCFNSRHRQNSTNRKVASSLSNYLLTILSNTVKYYHLIHGQMLQLLTTMPRCGKIKVLSVLIINGHK